MATYLGSTGDYEFQVKDFSCGSDSIHIESVENAGITINRVVWRVALMVRGKSMRTWQESLHVRTNDPNASSLEVPIKVNEKLDIEAVPSSLVIAYDESRMPGDREVIVSRDPRVCPGELQVRGPDWLQIDREVRDNSLILKVSLKGEEMRRGEFSPGEIMVLGEGDNERLSIPVICVAVKKTSTSVQQTP